MKRVINKLFPFAALAVMCLASCGESPVEPTPEPGKVELSLIVDNTSVIQGSKIPFKIEASNPPQSNVTINVESGDSKVLSVPPTLVLSEGLTEIYSEAVAVSAGETTLTISLSEKSDVTIKVPSVKITVKK